MPLDSPDLFEAAQSAADTWLSSVFRFSAFALLVGSFICVARGLWLHFDEKPSGRMAVGALLSLALAIGFFIRSC